MTRFSHWLIEAPVSMLVKTPAKVPPCWAITPVSVALPDAYVYEAASSPTPEMGWKVMLTPDVELAAFCAASAVEK